MDEHDILRLLAEPKTLKEEPGDGVFYVGFWYHRNCFSKLYGRKFGID